MAATYLLTELPRPAAESRTRTAVRWPRNGNPGLADLDAILARWQRSGGRRYPSRQHAPWTTRPGLVR